jgi:hypothetical protein
MAVHAFSSFRSWKCPRPSRSSPPFPQSLPGEKLLLLRTPASIDWLVRHSVILELNVVSYRIEHAQGKFKVDDATVQREEKEQEAGMSMQEAGTSQIGTAPNNPPTGSNKENEGKRKPGNQGIIIVVGRELQLSLHTIARFL